MKNIWATLRELLPMLPAGARRFFVVHVIASSALTVLDVAAMALLALVITPAVGGNPISIPILGTFPPSATPLLVLIACVLIIVKSALTVLLHWIATRRFAHYELEIGKRLFSAYVHSTWEERSKRSVAEITRIADSGIANTVMGFLLPLSSVPGNVLTFVLILLVLVVSQPLTAVIALAYLTLVALIVSKVITKRTLEASKVNLEYGYRVARLMTEMVEALKELTLRNRLGQVAKLVGDNRIHAVRARANTSFLNIIPRYAFEAALVGGFLLIGFASFLASGINGAIIAVALFAATGFRLIPAIAGLQTSILNATATMPWANDVLRDLKSAESNVADPTGGVDSVALAEKPLRLTLDGVFFTYPNAHEPVLRGLDLDVPLGSSLGIVGR